MCKTKEITEASALKLEKLGECSWNYLFLFFMYQMAYRTKLLHHCLCMEDSLCWLLLHFILMIRSSRVRLYQDAFSAITETQQRV